MIPWCGGWFLEDIDLWSWFSCEGAGGVENWKEWMHGIGGLLMGTG